MKINKLLKIILLALAFTACGVAPQAQQQPPPQQLPTGSPTEVFKAFIKAKNEKDVAAVKKTLSQNSLKMYEDAAKKKNTTLDEILIGDSGKFLKELPEMRNETIEGDAATVEIQHPVSGRWEKMYFVRENGEWKMAMDKFMEELDKQLGGLLKILTENANNSSPANGNNKSPKTVENKK
ncbi:MAG TPA: hypothetical protein VF721_12740 [Pyrinomonadaceae bacterium]